MWQKQFRYAYGASVKAALHNLHLMFFLLCLVKTEKSLSMGAETGSARTVVVFCPQSELIQEAMKPMFFKFCKKKKKKLKFYIKFLYYKKVCYFVSLYLQ